MIDKGVKTYIVKKIISIADEYKLGIKYKDETKFQEYTTYSMFYVIGFMVTTAILPSEEMMIKIEKINKKIQIPKISIIKHFENKTFVLYMKLNDIPTIERYIKIKKLIHE